MSDLEGSEGAFILADRLRQVPAKARRSTAKHLRAVGQQVAREAAVNSSWSSRIPGAISVQVRFSGRYPGVAVVVSQSQAPHARVYEGITGTREFDHPVFGNRSVWVAQATRPFLRPAVAASAGVLADEMEAAVGEAIADAGL